MKTHEIQKCTSCGKGLMHSCKPMFYQVKVQPYVFNAQAINEMAGMEMVMQGNVALARSFRDLDIAAPLGKEATAHICYDCMLSKPDLMNLIGEVE